VEEEEEEEEEKLGNAALDKAEESARALAAIARL